MVGLAVELAPLGVQVVAHAAHQLLAGGQHLVAEHGPPVFGDEHQVDMQVVDRAAAVTDIGIWLPVPHVAEDRNRRRHCCGYECLSVDRDTVAGWVLQTAARRDTRTGCGYRVMRSGRCWRSGTVADGCGISAWRRPTLHISCRCSQVSRSNAGQRCWISG